MIRASFLWLLASCVGAMVHGFTATTTTTTTMTTHHPRLDKTALCSAINTSPKELTRRSVVATLAAAAALGLPLPSYAAKEIDPALKGTKEDPAYQICVSTCMYECTKPKGAEQKSRQECLPECKKKCATTKQQLMIGSPIAK